MVSTKIKNESPYPICQIKEQKIDMTSGYVTIIVPPGTPPGSKIAVKVPGEDIAFVVTTPGSEYVSEFRLKIGKKKKGDGYRW
eukprot:CAMPEP_0198254750 /NCGR_PEP_ID=MMETSP1447-20131203/5022_1 /TAXON_ID=420782 /ORGANISM="Chaetoceros dichaeta, Strain CCMP1751" /LENGTH=82 /DNA_ID=CAMNT_0043940937 /DNA_START=36 /DNA_END=281 /DNA_ORIENTATION=-